MDTSLDVLIEGLLFYKAGPQKKQTLKHLFGAKEVEWDAALAKLRERLEHGALRLLETEIYLELVTAPELSEFIDTLRRDELSADIGKAGAETLAIILYREPVARHDIDRIRGVNSSTILRNLLTRGLIQRESGSHNQHYFRPTPALLAELGLTKKQDLPEYATTMDQIDALLSTAAS